MVEYHVSQRYHGPGSAFFQDVLRRVPTWELWVDDCSVCGHAVFVERAVHAAAERDGAPLICMHCVLSSQGVDTSTVLNIEQCPAAHCFYTHPHTPH